MADNNLEDDYDPISVEAALDDAYAQAENLGEYQEPVEEALGKIEALPYAIHGEGEYGREEVEQTLEGLAQLRKVSYQPTMDTTGDALKVGMEILKHDPEEMTAGDFLKMGENLEEMGASDNMHQAHQYSQTIDQIGERIVEDVYEPIVGIASEDSNNEYNDRTAEEMLEEVAEQTGINMETFEQAIKSVAQFRGELVPERESAV
jgi:hypothetical protein